jgi:hypothetical protein
MKILIACEFSGIVREAFARRGHDAWSCDLLPTEIPGQHIQGDVLKILNDGWGMMIAHPSCTRLCNSGVRWLKERKLWREMEEAAYFFKLLWKSEIPHICIENPIPHGYAINIIGRTYDQIIQPWMFGHGETKATCLWLKNLPKLQPTNIVTGREHKTHKMPGSKDQSKNRSRTFAGIAEAMAAQWSAPLTPSPRALDF